MRSLILLPVLLVLANCSIVPERFGGRKAEPAAAAPAPAAVPAPLAPKGARTAEQFDTTTAEQRAAALAAPAAAKESKLGSSIASLGDPASPGFWLETPLVSKVQQGRVVHPKSGASVQVELRPISGSAGSGSRISLPAMRLLGVPLTDLAEIEVFGS